jgi:hypothetical protein
MVSERGIHTSFVIKANGRISGIAVLTLGNSPETWVTGCYTGRAALLWDVSRDMVVGDFKDCETSRISYVLEHRSLAQRWFDNPAWKGDFCQKARWSQTSSNHKTRINHASIQMCMPYLRISSPSTLDEGLWLACRRNRTLPSTESCNQFFVLLNCLQSCCVQRCGLHCKLVAFLRSARHFLCIHVRFSLIGNNFCESGDGSQSRVPNLCVPDTIILLLLKFELWRWQVRRLSTGTGIERYRYSSTSFSGEAQVL